MVVDLTRFRGRIRFGPGEILTRLGIDDAHPPPCQGDPDELGRLAIVDEAIPTATVGGRTSAHLMEFPV